MVESRKSSMGAPLFQELKKQASFFLKDKIRTARLALTDVTPAQLWVWFWSFHVLNRRVQFFVVDFGSYQIKIWARFVGSCRLTEEATNGSPWAPDTRTMGLISRAAFEVDDYWRIVEILHQRYQRFEAMNREGIFSCLKIWSWAPVELCFRLSRFDRKQWREPYQALILLEHLLTHGPESVASEFQIDKDVIAEIGSFQHIDERGSVSLCLICPEQFLFG